MTKPDTPLTFRLATPDRVCRICHVAADGHASTCPVALLNGQIRELITALGMYVAQVHETLDTIGRVLDE